MLFFSDFSFANIHFLYCHGENISGIQNVFETKTKTLKHNAKSLGGPNKTTHLSHLFMNDRRLVYSGPPCIFCWKAVDKIRLVAQLDPLLAQKNHQLLKPPNFWCEVCIQTQGGF